MSNERDQLALKAAAQARPSPTGWYRANCPFCEFKTGKADRKQSWSILMSKGAHHCFKCGTSGQIKDFDPTKLGYEAISIEEVEVAKCIEPPEGFMLLCEEPARSAWSADPARAYLKKRGLPEDVWRAAKIGVCVSGQQAGRIIVPVLASGGDWVGWVGRIWQKKGTLPYIYPRGMQRGSVLYNQQALMVETDKPVLVVEGVFDSLALWPDSVAVLGKPSGTQVDALVAAKRPVAVVLDGDAWREGESLAMSLRIEGQRAGNVRLGPGVDPDEVNKSELWAAASECLDSSDSVTLGDGYG